MAPTDAGAMARLRDNEATFTILGDAARVDRVNSRENMMAILQKIVVDFSVYLQTLEMELMGEEPA
jgi:hypothetical protein